MAPSSPLSPAVGTARHRPDDGVHVDEMARASNKDKMLFNKSPKENNLLHQSALRRSGANSQSSEPVTVNPAPTPFKSDMKMSNKNSKTNKSSATTSSPDPAEFAFPALLSSLGPEADDAIDKIAEICGRSKMSLADSHGAHLPPLGGDVILHHVHKEPEEFNQSGVQTRSMLKRLGHERAGSTVVEERVNVGQRREHKSESNDDIRIGLVAQVLGWLRGSKAAEEPRVAERDLRCILGAEQAAGGHD